MQHGDVSAAGEGPALRDLILAQTHEGAGVPVLLRTSGPAPGERRPFGAGAYRLQVDLAVQLLAGGVPTGAEPGSLAATLLERPLLALNFHRIRRRNQGVVREQLTRAAALGASFDLDAPVPPPGEVRVLVGFYDGFARTAEFAADLCRELACGRCSSRSSSRPARAGCSPTPSSPTSRPSTRSAGTPRAT